MALTSCGDCGGKVSDKAPACPHCGAPASSAHQRAVDRRWFVRRDGASIGPVDTDQLLAGLRAGKVQPDDLAALEGTDDWKPVQSLEEIRGVWPAPTTPPVGKPQATPLLARDVTKPFLILLAGLSQRRTECA